MSEIDLDTRDMGIVLHRDIHSSPSRATATTTTTATATTANTSPMNTSNGLLTPTPTGGQVDELDVTLDAPQYSSTTSNEEEHSKGASVVGAAGEVQAPYASDHIASITTASRPSLAPSHPDSDSITPHTALNNVQEEDIDPNKDLSLAITEDSIQNSNNNDPSPTPTETRILSAQEVLQLSRERSNDEDDRLLDAS